MKAALQKRTAPMAGGEDHKNRLYMYNARNGPKRLNKKPINDEKELFPPCEMKRGGEGII